MAILDVNEILKQVIQLVSKDTPAKPAEASSPDDLLQQFLQSIRDDGKPPTPSPSSSNVKQTPTTTVMPESTGFQAPLKGTYYNSGAFGAGDARHNGVHNGVDLRISGGTPVYPMTEGIVVSVNSGGKGGNSVRIQHPDKIKTYYAHLGTVAVHVGDSVRKDTVIGTVGDSGNAKGTAPHVHFEVSQNGQLMNPNKFIPVPPYSNLQPGEKTWLSEEDKRTADSFNMSQHLATPSKTATSSKIETLEKIAAIYYKITKYM